MAFTSSLLSAKPTATIFTFRYTSSLPSNRCASGEVKVLEEIVGVLLFQVRQNIVRRKVSAPRIAAGTLVVFFKIRIWRSSSMAIPHDNRPEPRKCIVSV
jgi:hypothetical protein